MTRIENEVQYNAALRKVEELMLSVPEDAPADSPEMIELTLLGNLVADYEDEHFPIEAPSLVDMLKLRMYEMGLTQAALSKLLDINPSRICEYLSGKREPTLPQARVISQKLKIDPAIVLGV